MKTDLQLQQDVLEELKFEPSIREAEIGVAAKAGVVSLTGFVDSSPRSTPRSAPPNVWAGSRQSPPTSR